MTVSNSQIKKIKLAVLAIGIVRLVIKLSRCGLSGWKIYPLSEYQEMDFFENSA